MKNIANKEKGFRLSLGRKIRKLRRESELTQVELAEKVGFSRPSLSNIEKGQQSLSSFQLLLLAKALKINAELLLPTDDEVSASIQSMKRALQVTTSSNLLGKALKEKGVEVKESPSLVSHIDEFRTNKEENTVENQSN